MIAFISMLMFNTAGQAAHATQKPTFDKSKLIKMAMDNQVRSYAPYSNYNVSAAVLAESGKIYLGVNVENASYPAGICAERNAIFHAIQEGEKKIIAIAIVGGPNYTIKDYCAPCGICRQVMREFCNPAEFTVLFAKSPTDYKEMTKEILYKADAASLIEADMKVGIKPNLVAPSPAFFGSTTHPEIVEGIIEYLRENGINDIVIMEGSWVGDSTQDSFEYCGYNELSKENEEE